MGRDPRQNSCHGHAQDLRPRMAAGAKGLSERQVRVAAGRGLAVAPCHDPDQAGQAALRDPAPDAAGDLRHHGGRCGHLHGDLHRTHPCCLRRDRGRDE
nr:MAG TPA: hypothetical protein [Caudoviricetes sp.]